MAHLAFVAPPFLGHINPMVALARTLVARGHRATFLHMPDAAPILAARDLPFRPVGAASHPVGTLPGILRRLSGVNGAFGLGGIIRDVCAATDMLARDLPDALRAIGADALVCDASEAAGGLVAGGLDLPFVSVANALPLNREDSVPPPFTDWRYDPSDWGVERNRGGYRVSDWLMRPHARVIAEHAARWRLGPVRRLDECLSPLAQIGQTVAGFDMPRRELPAVFHHCGPLRAPSGEAGSARPTERDGRPLAYASFGTLQGGRVRLFRRVAKATRDRGLRLVLTHGGGLTEAQAATLPGEPSVHDFVRQDEVLRDADVAILHGGLNTVLDALAQGVPIAVMPIAFEQGAIAARVERAGAGLVVSRRALSGRPLARAIGRLVEEPAFRQAAGRLRNEIAAAGGAARAADIVERVLATGHPVTQDAFAAPGRVPVGCAA